VLAACDVSVQARSGMTGWQVRARRTMHTTHIVHPRGNIAPTRKQSGMWMRYTSMQYICRVSTEFRGSAPAAAAYNIVLFMMCTVIPYRSHHTYST
jgi:hypothetical protein